MSLIPPSQSPWRVLGGPLGSHTSQRARSVAAAASLAVALTAVPVLVAVLLRGWCLVNGFTGQVPLWRACYSDLPAMLQALRADGQTGDPVVTSSVMRLLSSVVTGSGTLEQAVFVLLWAVLALLLVAVCAVAITAYRSDHPDRALLFVLCPALPLGLLISADLVGVTLMTVGLVAWRLRRDASAGALLALAVFSRSLALIVVVAVVVVALQPGASGGIERVRHLVIGFVGAAAAVMVLGMATGAASLTEPLMRWWEVAPGYGSVWILPTLAGYPLPAGLVPWVALSGWVLAAALVLWLASRSWRPPVADLALVGMVVLLVTAPTVPVQASLWLVPLVALSSLPWRDMLIWAGVEVLYFPMVWLYLGGLHNPTRGLPEDWYVFVLLVRIVAIGYLAWRVVDLARFRLPADGRVP